MSTTDLKRAPDSPPSASAPSIKRTMSSNPAPAVSPSDLLVQKLSPSASLPTRGSALAAGYDIYASKATTIPAGGRTVVATDIAIAIPEGTYARVAPRSGLAVKHGIQTGAGVVDADYRGMVGVLLFNHGSEDFQGEPLFRVSCDPPIPTSPLTRCEQSTKATGSPNSSSSAS